MYTKTNKQELSKLLVKGTSSSFFIAKAEKGKFAFG